MRACEFCSAKVDDATNQCTGCGAAQSTPAQAVQQALQGDKPKGNWGCLIALIFVIWPAAIFYYQSRKWK
jgi:hypothetical protein